MVTEQSYTPVMRARARAYAVIQLKRHHPSPHLKKLIGYQGKKVEKQRLSAVLCAPLRYG